jgi:hypothetical protein
MLGVCFAERFDRLVDCLKAARLSHALRGKVAVRAGPIPVAAHRLRLKGHGDAKVLTKAM